jgi:drug/metabolite transporter (DMT)-like permease
VLFATVLSLSAAVLHAGWNLVAKRAEGDRFMVLWAQFVCATLVALPLLVGHQVIWGMRWQGYLWAALSGCTHLPYTLLLARAYTVGDFSVSYPVARGGGAALAALGGVLVLGDHLTALESLGIAFIVSGLAILAHGSIGRPFRVALLLAGVICVYTVIDAKGARVTGSVAYVFAAFVGTGLSTTVFGLATGRRSDMAAMLRAHTRRSLLTGAASLVTYGMVLVAVRHAPVGYVTALRESSVVLAAVAGWRLLGEGDHRRRLTAAFVVFVGLLVLISGN